MGEFEMLYQQFMRTGGFDQPCVTELMERFYRQREPHKPQRCIHGLTALSCAECNLNGFRAEHEWGT